MYRRLILSLAFALLILFTLAGPALADSHIQPLAAETGDWSLLVIGLTFLLPVGLILLSVAAFPEERAVSAVSGGLVAWGLAVLAYFAVGFAFQFGGIALYHDAPDLAGLYWEYSLLDTTWGTGWGMIGLRGFLMLNNAATPGALTLFLSHLPLLGMAVLIPYFALQGRTQRWVVLIISLLMGSLVYPLIGNWTWGGGWLANLGRNLAEGHGLVDAGGSGQVALVGASAALAALLVFRARPADIPTGDSSYPPDGSNAITTTDEETPLSEETLAGNAEAVPMPRVHLPIFGLLGTLLMVIGWMGMAFTIHIPTAVGISPVQMTVNLALGAFGGVLTAGLYSWFTTSNLNALMSARGLLAGLVVTAAGAPFVPAWAALAAGLVIGLLLPLLIYLFDRILRLDDIGSALATTGIPAIMGLLLPGFLADGRYGVGWNGTGLEKFLGIEGQGVSGLIVAPGFTADWPGQVSAQLVGMAAIFVWSFGLNWLVMQVLAGIIQAWKRTGLEFGAPPKPVAEDEEVLELEGESAQESDEEIVVSDSSLPAGNTPENEDD